MSLGSAAVLAGFLLLAPPLYVLGPLGLLLLLSRPRTFREWLWVGIVAAASWLSFRAPDGLAGQTIRTSAVLLSGIFAVIALAWRGPTLTRALLSVALAAVALGAWLEVRGSGWEEVTRAFAEPLREYFQLLLDAARQDSSTNPSLEAFLEQSLRWSSGIAQLVPGMLAVFGLAGVSIAWRWYHRIASSPAAPAPAPFRAFRFNDHLIWGAIFTLALALVSLPQVPAGLVHNLLLVWVGLYSARGAAVASSIFAPVPPLLKALGVLLALLLAPFSFGALLGMGIADTWLDLRGRLSATPASGGT